MTDPYVIRPVSILESAELAAKRTSETGERQQNPHPTGSAEAVEWHRLYCLKLLELSAEKYTGGQR